MADVVAIHGGSVVAPGEVDPELVERLEVLLDKARSGELTAVAYAYTDPEKRLSTGWEVSAETCHTMMSAISVLGAGYIAAIMET